MAMEQTTFRVSIARRLVLVRQAICSKHIRIVKCKLPRTGCVHVKRLQRLGAVTLHQRRAVRLASCADDVRR